MVCFPSSFCKSKMPCRICCQKGLLIFVKCCLFLVFLKEGWMKVTMFMEELGSGYPSPKILIALLYCIKYNTLFPVKTSFE